MISQITPGATHQEGEPVRIGVSACLLGERVRYDGGHKGEEFLTRRLARFAHLVPVCPEVEIGLGVPREPIELVRASDGVRLRGVDSARDLTRRMESYAVRRWRRLAEQGICGFVFKSRSPSCGLDGVPVRSLAGGRSGVGRGLFAGVGLRERPWMPCIGESELRDTRRRERFLTRAFAAHRIRGFFEPSWDRRALERFHTREAFLVLAHDASRAARLENLLISDMNETELASAYRLSFLDALAAPSDVSRHVEVLLRLAACLDNVLAEREKLGVHEAIDAFASGRARRQLALTRIRAAAERNHLNALASQTYLQPFPLELA